MKKMKCMILMIVFTVLCGCSEKEDKDVLVFPETTWGMNIQETLDRYEITREDTRNYMEGGRGTAFILEGYEVFGEISYRVQFNYLDFSDNGNYELCRVQVTYPESVDMQSVLEKMKKTYGETVSEIVAYREYSPLGDDILTKVEYTDSEQMKVWAGRTVDEFISESESERYEQNWEFFQDGLTTNNWEEFIQNARMVYVIWVAKEGVNVLEFDAYNLGVYTTLKSQLEKQQ